jgi:hypothetical protein
MNALIKCLAVATILTSGFVLFEKAQDAKGGKQDAMVMPTPDPEHKWLADGAGTWKATGKMYMSPTDAKPLNGTQTNTMQQGGLWQITDYKEADGSFVGHGITGYDPLKKKFVGVWVDPMTKELAMSEGTLSADKKTLTMEFTMTEPGSGTKMKMTETITRKDDKTVQFDMTTLGPDGKPMKVLEITYTKM